MRYNCNLYHININNLIDLIIKANHSGKIDDRSMNFVINLCYDALDIGKGKNPFKALEGNNFLLENSDEFIEMLIESLKNLFLIVEGIVKKTPGVLFKDKKLRVAKGYLNEKLRIISSDVLELRQKLIELSANSDFEN